MGECLVTRLKGSINDSALSKLGELKGNVILEDSSFNFISSVQQTISLLENATGGFKGNNNAKTIVAPANGTISLGVNKGKGVISIPNKYAIVRWEDYDSCEINLDDLAYSNGLNYFRGKAVKGMLSSIAKYNLVRCMVNGSALVEGNYNDFLFPSSLEMLQMTNFGKIDGNITSAFSNLKSLILSNSKVNETLSNINLLSNLTEIRVDNTPTNGNLSQLNNLVNLDGLYIGNTDIEGSLDDLANSLIAKGRNATSHPQLLINGNGKVSFNKNGVVTKVGNNLNATIKFTNDTYTISY